VNQKEELETDVLSAVARVGISTMLFRNTLSKSLKLTLTESLCLTLLAMKGPLSPSVLSRLVGLTSGATTTMLDRLEKRAFIRRTANPADRRGIKIHLTQTHTPQAQALVAEVQKAHKQLIGRYSEQELRLLGDFLSRFTRNLVENSEDVSFLFEDDLGD
jgi:DNA-binding MarR family transcriptional regulator